MTSASTASATLVASLLSATRDDMSTPTSLWWPATSRSKGLATMAGTSSRATSHSAWWSGAGDRRQPRPATGATRIRRAQLSSRSPTYRSFYEAFTNGDEVDHALLAHSHWFGTAPR